MGDPFADHISASAQPSPHPSDDPFAGRVVASAGQSAAGPTAPRGPMSDESPSNRGSNAPRQSSPSATGDPFVGRISAAGTSRPSTTLSPGGATISTTSPVDKGRSDPDPVSSTIVPPEPEEMPAANSRGRDPDRWSPVRVFAKARERKGKRPVRKAAVALWRRPQALLAAGALTLLALVALTAPPQSPLRDFLPSDSTPGEAAVAAPPTEMAREEIPPIYLSLYVRFGEEMNIDWRLLAAIGWNESNHGRDPASRRVNASGCVGPMQLGVGGACGDFVSAWGRDGNDDGEVNPRNPADAIATAAYGLRQGKGAPAIGGSFEEHRRAACNYFGACSDDGIDYADRVMARAVDYGFRG